MEAMEDLARYVSRVANETYGQSRRIMPEQPWWQNLDPSFHKFPDDFYLDLKTQAMVNGTAVIDKAICASVGMMAATFALPQTLNQQRFVTDMENARFYEQFAESHDADRFFKRPEHKVTVRSYKPGPLEYRPKVGSVEILSFESPFEAVNPAMRESYGRFNKNRIAWAEHWRHDDKPRPTICLIHGFVADSYWINSRFLAMPWFYEQGYDVMLYTLPFHGRRKEPTAPFSGHGYFSYGFSHTNEAMAHAVHDFRLFLDYLEEQGVPKVGVTGISLGGYTTGLLAAVEDRLEFAIPNVPLSSMIDVMLQWFPSGPMLKAQMRLADVDLRTLRHVTAVHSPLTYTPKLSKDRLMIVGGAGDRFAPPKHTRLLWDHWDRPRLHWFPGNHLMHLDQGRYLKEMAGFMRSLGFDKA